MRKNDLLTNLYREGKIKLKVNSIKPRSLDKIGNDITTVNQLAKLFYFFESSFRKIAEKHEAKAVIPPTIISRDILQKADYFVSFPDVAVPLDKHSCLNPALCYHVYHIYGGKHLNKSEYVSLMGQCFRHEKSYAFLQRMKNFSMFEIVAIGDYKEVERFRKSLLVDTFAFAEKLGLQGQLERAYDPFFVNKDNKGKVLLQKLFPLKFELKIKTGGKNDLAVASFNNHQDFFGRRFHILLAKKIEAHSGCVAFGIERWIYAFLSHFGMDEKTWPSFINLHKENEVS